MKKNKPVKLAIAGLIGCGLCCLPLLLPLATGLMGMSILGFSLNSALCAAIFLILAAALYGLYRTKRKKVCVAHSCE